VDFLCLSQWFIIFFAIIIILTLATFAVFGPVTVNTCCPTLSRCAVVKILIITVILLQDNNYHHFRFPFRHRH
jgi:hypothetical protein